jgi:hypothetical protein
MPDRSSFQYTILRVVPHVERGEQLNAGVVVYSPELKFLGARVALDDARLAALAPRCEPGAVRAALDALVAVAAGEESAGAIGAMSASERFGWLAAPSSTVVQPSDVHTGLTDDPAAVLEHLFATLVLVQD